jgi:hypothetical protein
MWSPSETPYESSEVTEVRICLSVEWTHSSTIVRLKEPTSRTQAACFRFVLGVAQMMIALYYAEHLADKRNIFVTVKKKWRNVLRNAETIPKLHTGVFHVI